MKHLQVFIILTAFFASQVSMAQGYHENLYDWIKYQGQQIESAKRKDETIGEIIRRDYNQSLKNYRGEIAAHRYLPLMPPKQSGFAKPKALVLTVAVAAAGLAALAYSEPAHVAESSKIEVSKSQKPALAERATAILGDDTESTSAAGAK